MDRLDRGNACGLDKGENGDGLLAVIGESSSQECSMTGVLGSCFMVESVVMVLSELVRAEGVGRTGGGIARPSFARFSTDLSGKNRFLSLFTYAGTKLTALRDLSDSSSEAVRDGLRSLH